MLVSVISMAAAAVLDSRNIRAEAEPKPAASKGKTATETVETAVPGVFWMRTPNFLAFNYYMFQPQCSVA